MSYEKAKSEFIATWGRLGTEWGINRTMAEIHALLLASPEPMTTDEIMEKLQISRGNANMNLRALIDWRLLYKEVRPGERKELYGAEKDIWEITRRIARERQRRELLPLMESLDGISDSLGKKPKAAEAKEFKKLVDEIRDLGHKSEVLLDLVLKVDESGFFRPLLNLRKKVK